VLRVDKLKRAIGVGFVCTSVYVGVNYELKTAKEKKTFYELVCLWEQQNSLNKKIRSKNMMLYVIAGILLALLLALTVGCIVLLNILYKRVASLEQTERRYWKIQKEINERLLKINEILRKDIYGM